jgi:hypothetical protein
MTGVVYTTDFRYSPYRKSPRRPSLAVADRLTGVARLSGLPPAHHDRLDGGTCVLARGDDQQLSWPASRAVRW